MTRAFSIGLIVFIFTTIAQDLSGQVAQKDTVIYRLGPDGELIPDKKKAKDSVEIITINSKGEIIEENKKPTPELDFSELEQVKEEKVVEEDSITIEKEETPVPADTRENEESKDAEESVPPNEEQQNTSTTSPDIHEKAENESDRTPQEENNPEIQISEKEKKPSEDSIQQTEIQQEPVQEKLKEKIEKTSQAPPPPPPNVEQKDNVYGTVRLAYDDLATSFLLSIPTETKMHYHNEHSEHILLVEGDGMVLLGYKTIELKRNEVIFVSKGTPHKIINKGRSPLKVLSIQAPFYDGSDIVILE